MRIIGGQFRGAKLNTPTSSSIRPTSDKVRQALFNILTHKHHVVFQDKKILDICAGTGALGLEALSHGAHHCHFIDHDEVALKLVRTNAEKLRLTDKTSAECASALNLPLTVTPYDLIFLDPPYHKGLSSLILEQLWEKKYLHKTSLIVVEEAKGEHVPLPPGLKLLDQRHYGSTQIMVVRVSC